MILNIQLAGIAKEISGKEMIKIELESHENFQKTLMKTIPELKNYTYKISLNGSLVNDLSGITQEDNILVFSPIAGG